MGGNNCRKVLTSDVVDVKKVRRLDHSSKACSGRGDLQYDEYLYTSGMIRGALWNKILGGFRSISQHGGE